MTYLLDTNVVSELRKGPRCDANVRRWFSGVQSSELFISVVVLGEIRNGLERVRPRDPAKARVLERWLVGLHEHFEDRIIAIDSQVADAWGRIRALRTVSVIDTLFAATALVHEKTLVTRNVADVSGLGANILNPFAP